jgi:hypothetical protein
MSLSQLGYAALVEVPCFFLLCMLFWKLGSLAIAKWSVNEAERTIAIAKGFADITAELKHRLGRIEERLDVRDGIAEAIEEITGAHALP